MSSLQRNDICGLKKSGDHQGPSSFVEERISASAPCTHSESNIFDVVPLLTSMQRTPMLCETRQPCNCVNVQKLAVIRSTSTRTSVPAR
jgi:hypothetical protein